MQICYFVRQNTQDTMKSEFRRNILLFLPFSPLSLYLEIILNPKGLIHIARVMYISLLCYKTVSLWLSHARTMLMEGCPWWVSNLLSDDSTVSTKSMNTLGSTRCLGRAMSLERRKNISGGNTPPRERNRKIATYICFFWYCHWSILLWSLTRHYSPFFNNLFRTL